MKKRLLYCMAEGIGNVVQTVPAIRTIKERLGYDIDFWHAFGSFDIPKFIPYVDNWYNKNEIRSVDFSSYDGKIVTFWTRRHANTIPLPALNKIIPFSPTESEVENYLMAARDLGVSVEDFIWEGECLFEPTDKSYDVVIINGYNFKGPSKWVVKSYPYYSEVANILKGAGFSVCSIGKSEEYVENTIDETGRNLLSSFGLIKNSGLLLCNDTGLYHAANLLGTNNVVVFTVSLCLKAYDKRFHKNAHPISRHLPCSPCYGTQRWLKDCKNWRCREIDPQLVANKVIEVLRGGV
jgi:ADP-heptose:LPS heptosyltransferase